MMIVIVFSSCGGRGTAIMAQTGQFWSGQPVS
jgi:hypothetical protein